MDRSVQDLRFSPLSFPSPFYRRPSKGSTTLYILISFNTMPKEGIYRDWFSIDLSGIKLKSSQEIDEKIFLNKPLFRMPSDMPDRVSCVSMGSKIYALGGADHNNGLDPIIYNTAYVYDTAAEDNNRKTKTRMSTPSSSNWESLPPMQTIRCEPSVFVLDGKLFVMGCNASNRSRGLPWAEFYDPIKKCWSTLIPYPPIDLILETLTQTNLPSAYCLVVAESDNTPKMFLIHFDAMSKSFLYSPKLDAWKEVLLPFDLIFSYPDCAVTVDEVIFLDNTFGIYAYDLMNGGFLENLKKYKIPDKRPEAKIVKGLENDYPLAKYYQRSFFHLGKMDFCLVWACIDRDSCCVHTIHCLRFHIDREGDDDWLASVLSHDLYSVPVPDGCHLSYLENCVVQVM